MNGGRCMSVILSSVLVLSAGLARGQQAPPPPPPEAMMHAGPGGEWIAPPMGERIELLGFEGMHGGKVVTGAPFSAVAISETTQTLSDGNHITRQTQTNLFRDSQGRSRREVTFPAIGPLATAGHPNSFVMINDPVSNSNYVLHAESKTAEKIGGHGMKGQGKGGMKDAIKDKIGTHQQELLAEGNLKKEDLGTQSMAGVSAQGTRTTRTIPAGQVGNEKPINIVSERWYSNDLQIVVMSKRSDPRFGETTYKLMNIQKSEPNAALFSVPPDYTVKQGGMMGRHGRKGSWQAPPPPPND